MRFAACLAAASLMLAAPASAQTFQKAEDAIKYRRASFTVLAAHLGPLGAMANGRMPFDARAATRHADVLATVATLPWTGFVPGTDKGDTRARPDIWKEDAKFKAAAEKMQAETQKLAAAARTGSLDNLKVAFAAASQSCKACHQDFRND